MCAWHANEYFIESGRNSDQQKNYFDPKRSLVADKSLWARLPLSKKSWWRIKRGTKKKFWVSVRNRTSDLRICAPMLYHWRMLSHFLLNMRKKGIFLKIDKDICEIFLNKILFKNVASYKVLGLLHYGSRNGAKFNRSNCCQHQHLLLRLTIKFDQLQQPISI